MSSDQTLDFVRDIIRLQNLVHVKFPSGPLPEELALLKNRLAGLQPKRGPKRSADYDLVLRIGLILQRRQEAPKMSELGDELGVPLSSATRMVDWLVESGYVERLADPADRRIVRVALTGTGVELYETITEFLRSRVESLLADFSLEEREELVALLRKFVDALERKPSHTEGESSCL